MSRAAPAEERLTLGRYIRDLADRFGEAPAAVYHGEAISFVDLERRTRATARALVAAGVVKGTRVGVLMGNRPEFVTTVFAVGLAGGVAVPVSTFATAGERDQIMRHSDMAMLVLQERLAGHRYVDELAADHPELAGTPGSLRSRSFPFLRRVVSLGSGGPFEDWDDFVGGGASVDDGLLEAADAEIVPYDDAVVIYTSGTTAEPKGVVHTHRAVAGQLWRWGDQLKLTPADRVWSAFPLFWVAGFATFLGGTLSAGACMVLQDGFDPAETLELLERERVTTIHAFPNANAQLAAHPDVTRRDLSSLRNVTADSALSDLLGLSGREGSWDMAAGYGSSETFSVSTALPMDLPLAVRRSSHGLPLPGMSVQVVDVDDGRPLPPGESGEITVKGVYLMRTYHKVAPERCFDEEGWFHSGDAGHLDEDGHLHWHGRISRMIKTGGCNVAPVEVEAQALRSGMLSLACVVGLPHPTLGEAVVLGGVARDPDVTVERLVEHLRTVLSSYKVPRRVLLFEPDQLHLTDNDKVRADEVRRLAVERLLESEEDEAWRALLAQLDEVPA
ncbi:MAG: class I adenylate-forming enzyme family protein [Acidimicrobiales bacterium]